MFSTAKQAAEKNAVLLLRRERKAKQAAEKGDVLLLRRERRALALRKIQQVQGAGSPRL
jgi:hypothetical protein